MRHLAWLALLSVMIMTPELALAQASPFMTGASSLQTNIFALLRTLGRITGVHQLLDPCRGEIRWAGGDALRDP